MTKRQRQVPTPTCNRQLNTNLLNILDTILPTKAKVARIIGVSYRTFERWQVQGHTDDWHWWNIVLRASIDHIMPTLTIEKRISLRKKLDQLPEEFVTAVYQQGGCYDWLQSKLMTNGPTSIIDLTLGAPFSRKTIYKAALQLCVIKETSGYGEDKMSIWRLRTPEDE